MATAGLGEEAVGLTILIVAVTDVVWTVPHAGVAVIAAAQAAAGVVVVVVVVLRGWVVVVVVAAAVVLVAGVTADGAEATVFVPEWPGMSTQGLSAVEAPGSVLPGSSWEVAGLTAPPGRVLCCTRAETLVPLPFWAMLATMWLGSLCRAMVGVPRSRAMAD